jgi:hypothetical protein
MFDRFDEQPLMKSIISLKTSDSSGGGGKKKRSKNRASSAGGGGGGAATTGTGADSLQTQAIADAGDSSVQATDVQVC